MSGERKVYLADSVYFEFRGHDVMLTTENGFGATNTIYMDRDVIVAFLRALGTHFDRKSLRAAIGQDTDSEAEV